MNSGVMMPPAVDSPYWRRSWISSASAGGISWRMPGGLLLGQGLDHVRRFVGRHLVEDAGDLALVERRHQRETAAVVHLVEDGAGRFARELAKHGDLLGEVQVPERSREVLGVRLGQEARERVPVGVPEPPADLLEEIAGVPGFHQAALRADRGGELGGGATGGPVRVAGLVGRRLHFTKRAARPVRAAASPPVAAEAIVTTATDAESSQWRKRTVTASGFWNAKTATANRRTATTARRACIDYERSRSCTPPVPLLTSSS